MHAAVAVLFMICPPVQLMLQLKLPGFIQLHLNSGAVAINAVDQSAYRQHDSSPSFYGSSISLLQSAAPSSSTVIGG